MKPCFLLVVLVLAACRAPHESCGTEEPRLVIAMAQIFCIAGDRPGNFVRIEAAVREAKEKGADLVCFPEMAILGWVNPEAHQLAHPIPGPDTERLQGLAKKHGIYLCVGLGEKVGEQLFDSIVLIDSDGQLLLKHRKINVLNGLMDPPYTPGSGVQTIDTPHGKIGLLICADSFQAEVLAEMKALKPELVLVAYGWAKEKEDWPEHGLQLENTVKNAAQILGCPVIGTDLVGAIGHGPWAGLVFGGLSVAADAAGTVLSRGKDRERDVVLVQLH